MLLDEKQVLYKLFLVLDQVLMLVLNSNVGSIVFFYHTAYKQACCAY